MVKKSEPFYTGCSSRTCTEVKEEVSEDYDKNYYRRQGVTHPPQPHSKGGAHTSVMEQAQARKIGYLGTYTVKEHGLAIEAKRCREFKYYNRQGEQQTPTCTERRIYNIPQRTMRCYQIVNDLLEALSRGKKGAPPTTSHKILALLGCSKSDIGKTAVSTPLSPYIIAPAIGVEHNAVRKTMENLVASRKVTASTPWLDVVDEKQNRLAPTYQKAFDEFVTSERETRKWMAFRRIFGDELAAEATPELPEQAPWQYYGTPRTKLPKKQSKRAIEQFKKEAEAWKIRTGLAPPLYGKKPRKAKRIYGGKRGMRIQKAPRKPDIYKQQAYAADYGAIEQERQWAQEAEAAL